MAISNFVSRCLDGEPPVVYGDGTQTRDFTCIGDVLDADLADVVDRQQEDRADAAFLVEEVSWEEASRYGV